MISTGGTPVTSCCTGWMEHPEKMTDSSGRIDLAARAPKACGAPARLVSLALSPIVMSIAAPNTNGSESLVSRQRKEARSSHCYVRSDTRKRPHPGPRKAHQLQFLKIDLKPQVD